MLHSCCVDVEARGQGLPLPVEALGSVLSRLSLPGELLGSSLAVLLIQPKCEGCFLLPTVAYYELAWKWTVTDLAGYLVIGLM